jgi:hypothetical protein
MKEEAIDKDDFLPRMTMIHRYILQIQAKIGYPATLLVCNTISSTHENDLFSFIK